MSNIDVNAVKVLLTTCGDCLKCSSHVLSLRQLTPTRLNEGNYLGILTPGMIDPSLNNVELKQ